MGGAERAGEGVMDRLRLVRSLGIAGTGIGLAVALRFAVAPVITSEPVAGYAEARGPALVAPSPRADVDSLSRAIVTRNPFRIDRASAAVSFNPDVAAGTAPAPTPPSAPPPRPALSLVGLILGPEPAALVDGFPGVEGSRTLRVGEGVARYVIRAIGDGHVVIAGPDTTWTLRLRSHAQ
jgi:hypothetical protein